MWCGKCQADVAAEVSADNQRVYCSVCSTLLSTIDLPPARPGVEKPVDRTKDARELLQRWSSGQILDPFGPPMKAINASKSDSKLASPRIATAPIANSETNAEAAPASSGLATITLPSSVTASVSTTEKLQGEVDAETAPSSERERTRELVDCALRSTTDLLAANSISLTASSTPNPFANANAAAERSTTPTPNPIAATSTTGAVYRIDAPHPADHFAGVKPAITPQPEAIGPFSSRNPAAETKRESRRPALWLPSWDPAVWRSEPNASAGWASMAGQFLAYVGVLGMTAGACLVVWSHFGGPTNYASTGWLLATAGQMLLFFGVVTLVSGGLEQTTEQVNKRIEQLGDHIIRIEQAARELSTRGESMPPAHFGSDSSVGAPPRSAASGYERSIVEQ